MNGFWKPGDNEPVRVMTVKPVELEGQEPARYYRNAIISSGAPLQPLLIQRRTFELDTTTHFFEYHDINLWLEAEMPIFGKFDFLKDLK